MTKDELTTYVTENYRATTDHPWADHLSHEVCRHTATGKWFALLMDIPAKALGLAGEDKVWVVNLKCDPLLVGSLRAKKGIYPAYHMNKENWISVALAEADEDELKTLLDMSYNATAPKLKKRAAKKNAADV